MSRRNKAEKAELAWQAIDHLVEHDLVVKWEFDAADPPPDEVKRLIAPYFSDGEIERTTAWRLRDYLVECLEEDFLLVDERSQPSQDRSASRRSPVFRVVCGDDD
jgi:hypothetical protein